MSKYKSVVKATDLEIRDMIDDPKVIDRFMEYLKPGRGDMVECTIWIGPIVNGIPYFHFQYKRVRAHVFALALATNIISEKVYQSCGNPWCCKVDHLYIPDDDEVREKYRQKNISNYKFTKEELKHIYFVGTPSSIGTKRSCHSWSAAKTADFYACNPSTIYKIWRARGYYGRDGWVKNPFFERIPGK